MKNKLTHRFTVTLAAVLCMAASSVTAYAGGANPDPEPLPETTEAPLPEETKEPTTGGIETEPKDVPVTPKGNAALVDDFFEDKQLITVITEAGNYFYILTNRANEDKETVVHFLNQVNDADLQAPLEDGETEPEHCTCTAKCEAGAVNTNCPVCKNDRNACTGPEPEAPKPEETKSREEKPNGMCRLVVLLAVVLTGGGAALYYFKFRKLKESVRDGDDPAGYDSGYDEDDEEEAPEPDDAQESEEDWLIEKEAPEQNKEDEK